VLAAAESLLFGRGQYLTINHERGGAVMENRVDPENRGQGVTFGLATSDPKEASTGKRAIDGVIDCRTGESLSRPE
jgi:hypothetical protein